MINSILICGFHEKGLSRLNSLIFYR